MIQLDTKKHLLTISGIETVIILKELPEEILSSVIRSDRDVLPCEAADNHFSTKVEASLRMKLATEPGKAMTN